MTNPTEQDGTKRVKRTFTVEFDEPDPHWLNADNLAWLLENHAPGGRPYKVTETTEEGGN